MTRIIDLTVPLRSGMRGVRIEPAMRLETDGWNASQLVLYSHCGTHMDAPCHFRTGAEGIDRTSLAACVGPARVIDLTPIAPRERITVARLLAAGGEAISAGDRVLLRTDWSTRLGAGEYRDALPRIAVEAARWLVERGVVLLGVEPPSVADVHNLDELKQVHSILLDGGVVIVEGLAHLNALRAETVDLIVLPLSVEGCDGSPVRAIAIEKEIAA